MVVMAGLRRLYIAFSGHFSVRGSLPSLSFPLTAGESGDLGIFFWRCRRALAFISPTQPGVGHSLHRYLWSACGTGDQSKVPLQWGGRSVEED